MAIQVGGTTVINNSRQLQNVASVDATTVATLNAAGIGGGSGVAGITWATVSSGITTNLNAVASDENGTWIIVGDSGAVVRSTNNGVSWSSVSTPAGTGSSFTCVGYGDGVWIIGIEPGTTSHYNQCLRSTNGGATWSLVNHNLNKKVFDLDTDGSGVWVLSADREQISRSTNGGVNWSTISFGNDFQNQGIATDGSGNWVCCEGFYRALRTSTDNGASWTARSVGSGTWTFSKVATNKSGEWVASGGGGTFRSTNLSTWTAVPSVYIGSDKFYYDSDVGAYTSWSGANVIVSSTDGFQTSSTNFSGINAKVIRGDNNGTFIAVNNGGGLYRGTI